MIFLLTEPFQESELWWRLTSCGDRVPATPSPPSGLRTIRTIVTHSDRKDGCEIRQRYNNDRETFPQNRSAVK